MQRTATEHESLLIEQGIAAEELLRNQTFITVLNALSNQYITELLATKPTQAPEREALYNLTKASQGIVQTLQEWVSVKDEIAEKLNTEIEDY